MAVVMVMGLMVQEAVGQSPVGSKCAGPRSCSERVKRSGCGWCATPLDGAVNGSLAVIGCVEGSFSSGSGCKSHDYMAKQCTVANLYIVLGLVGLGLLMLCCCYLCIWWKCRKRSKRKSKRLLED